VAASKRLDLGEAAFAAGPLLERDQLMPDTYGWRLKLGVVTPSTNTVLSTEFDWMRPPGVTNHVSRMHLGNVDTHDQAGFNEMLRQVNAALEAAVDRIMTCEPDHLILGISGESVWGGGLEPSREIRRRILERSGGVEVTQPADAVPQALRAYGIKRKVALVTPYHPSADARVREFFDAIGYELVRAKHMGHAKPTLIAKTSEDELRAALREVDGPEVEAIVQMGANLPMGRVAAEAERWIGKPVFTANVATYWLALRRNGIDDKIYGWGRLLAEQ
jgi:maleate isomerase